MTPGDCCGRSRNRPLEARTEAGADAEREARTSARREAETLETLMLNFQAMYVCNRRVLLSLIAVAVSLAGATSRAYVQRGALLLEILAPQTQESDDVRIVAGRPQLAGRGSITIDIDRDGDLDVIGTSSDALLAVWINDGSDHFTRTVPARRATGLAGGAGAYREQVDGTIVAVPPSPKWSVSAVLSTRAPRAPDLHAGVRPSTLAFRLLGRDLRATPSRAPPALTS
jgi:hypothetical protein